jgi:hypothetical protein
MIRYIALLTTMLLLTVSCLGGSDTETAQVATSAPTATPIPTRVPFTPTPTTGRPTAVTETAQVATSAPTATPIPTRVPFTPTPTTGRPTAVTVCDWVLSYVIQDGFLHLTAKEAPQSYNIQSLVIEYTPAIRGVNHPIFNETGGFALHEYSKETLDVSKIGHQVAIPKAKTAYRMDLKIMLVSSTADGRNCQEELHPAFTRSDDYYPSPQLLLPDNALPNYERYAEYLDKIPQPNAQSVVLATSSGDWNDNWETTAVRKVDIPIRIGFFGDVGLEDYETIRDLLEILVVIAPDLDIGYANSLEGVTLPIHFVECTELLNRDSKHCRIDGPSGSLSGRLSGWKTLNGFWVRISGQRFNRHTLTHEMGHVLGLYHWNLENCSMGYGRAQTQWWSEWDLMAISSLQHSASNWAQSRDSMRKALGITEDAQWIRYTENPDLLRDTPDSTWVELANLLEIQAMEAIGQTEPKY